MQFMMPRTIDPNSEAHALSTEERTTATTTKENTAGSRTANALLWIAQGLLALLFLFTGSMKLVLPLEELAGPVALPGLFLRFIGVCEVLGALGLVLPGLLRIRPGLTPLAAAGLVIIMGGATTLTAASSGIAPALFPLVVGLLAATVAYGRRSALQRRSVHRPVFRPVL